MKILILTIALAISAPALAASGPATKPAAAEPQKPVKHCMKGADGKLVCHEMKAAPKPATADPHAGHKMPATPKP